MNFKFNIQTHLLFILCIYFVIITKSNGFDFLNRIFDDLRVGSFSKDYLLQKLDNSKLKCLQGSYFFNGSCYFISDKKYTDRSSYLESDNFFDYLKQRGKNVKSIVSNSIVSPDITSTITSLPAKSIWFYANTSCAKLNNDSTLFHFKDDSEYEHILNLLKELNFPENKPNGQTNSAVVRKEQKYFIGLKYDNLNGTWKWVDDSPVSNYHIEKFDLNNKIVEVDREYSSCSYLQIRKNGDVKIGVTNCETDEFPYICKYILDRCFNNTQCGRNGECINRPSKRSFECRCRIFYDGDKCQYWSTQGIQMLITVGLVIGAFLVVTLIYIINHITFRFSNSETDCNKELNILNGKGAIRHTVLNPLLPQQRMSIIEIKTTTIKSCFSIIRSKLKLFILIIISLLFALFFLLIVSLIRFKMIEYKIDKYQRQFSVNSTETQQNDIDEKPSKLNVVLSYDVCKLINDQFFEDYILVFISFPLTVIIYIWNAYKCNIDHEFHCRFSKLRIRKNKTNSTQKTLDDTITSDKSLLNVTPRKNKNIGRNRESVLQNLSYSCSYLCERLNLNRIKSLKCTMCGLMCSCNFTFPVPINPFSKRNRFITAIIYAAYTYNILKIFEYLIVGDQHIQTSNKLYEKTKLLFQNASLSNMSLSDINKGFLNKYDEVSTSFTQFSERGILMDLLKQICNVVIIGLRYYPVLLCVELKRKSKFIYFLTTLYVLFLLVSYLYMNIFCLLSASQAIKDANSQYGKNFLSDKIKSELLGETTTPIPEFDNRPSNLLASENDPYRLVSKMKRINKTVDEVVINSTNRTSHDLNKMLRLLSVHYFKNDQIVVKQTSDKLVSIDININTSVNPQFGDRFKLNSSDFDMIKNTLFLNNIMYEKFLFYAVLCMITFNMLFEFFKLIKRSIYKLICQICCIKCKEKCITEKMPEKVDYLANRYKHEVAYTKRIFQSYKAKPVSCLRYLFEKYIYKNDQDFRFSKQFINTQMIAFVLLYYITCIIIRKSNLIVNMSSSLLIFLINLIFKSNSESSSYIINSKAQLNALILSLFDNISSDVMWACLMTSGIYIIQLFMGIKNYKKNVLNSYKGIYSHIPSPKQFSNTKITSSSLHYSGYSIGYLLWGYLILFEVSVVVIILIKFLIKFYFITESLAKIVLPITTIFLFKRIIIWFFSKYFFANKSRGFSLRNHKLYFILNHFNFFFDCFLGSFVCFMRMSKSSFAALFFMPRLDYSIFGRQLERTDLGFISYVTFIHMDVKLTHPVKVAFCECLRTTMIEQDEETDDNKKTHNKKARNKWQLAYTLIKNPTLKKQRKEYLKKLRSLTISKRVLNYFDEKMKKFFTIDSKLKSKSTPNLLNIDEKIPIPHSTINMEESTNINAQDNKSNFYQNDQHYYVNIHDIDYYFKN